MKKFTYKHIHNYAILSLMTIDRKAADVVMSTLVDNSKDWSFIDDNPKSDFAQRKGMLGKLVNEKA